MKKKLLAALLVILLVLQVFAPATMAAVPEQQAPEQTAEQVMELAAGRGLAARVRQLQELAPLSTAIVFNIPNASGNAGEAVTVTLPFTNPGVSFAQLIVHWDAPLTLVPGSISFSGWPNPTSWPVLWPLIPAAGPAGMQWSFLEEANVNNGTITMQLMIPPGTAPGPVGEVWVVGGPNTISPDEQPVAVESNRAQVRVRPSVIDIDVEEDDGDVTIAVAPPGMDYDVDVEDGNIIITLPEADEDTEINVTLPNSDWDYDICEDEDGNIIVIITPPDGYEVTGTYPDLVLVPMVTVTFLPGANGTLTGDTNVRVRRNTAVAAGQVPTPAANFNWRFTGWSPADPVGFNVGTENRTFTAQWEWAPEDWDISIDIDVDTDGNVTVTVQPDDMDYDITVEDGEIIVTLPDADDENDITVTLPNNEWSYRPGVDGDGNIIIIITPPDGYEVTGTYPDLVVVRLIDITFLPGTNGTLTGTTSFQVHRNTVLAAGQVPTPAANFNWRFDGWSPANPDGFNVGTENRTFTAQWTFAPEDWDISIDIDVDTDGNVTVTVQPDDMDYDITVEDGEIIVTLPDADSGNDITVTLPNNEWSYRPGVDGDGNIIVIITPPDGYEVTGTYPDLVVVALINITFLPGTNGTLTGTTSFQVSRNTVLAAGQVPTPSANFNWRFDGWSPANPDGFNVGTQDRTFTAQWVWAPEDWDISIDIDVDTDGNVTVTVQPDDMDYDITVEDGEIIVTLPDADSGSDITVTLPNNEWSYRPGVDGDGNIIVIITPPDGYEVTGTYPDLVVVALLDITFLPGTNGTLTGTTSFQVRRNTVLTAGQVPTPVANFNYRFTGWSPANPDGFNVGTENRTFTAQWEWYPGDWDISIDIDVDTDGNVTVTIQPDDMDYDITVEDGEIIVTLPDADPENDITVTLPNNEWSYRPGVDGDGNIIIIITPPDGYEVTGTYPDLVVVALIDITFLPGTNGTLTGTTSFQVHRNTVLTAGQVPTPAANWNWRFDGWSPANPDGFNVGTQDRTFTAQWIWYPGDWDINIDVDVDEDGNVTIVIEPDDIEYNIVVEDGNIVITFPGADEDNNITVTLPNNEWDYETSTNGDGDLVVTIIPPPGYEVTGTYPDLVVEAVFTITFHLYDGSDEYEVVRVTPNQALSLTALADRGIPVAHIQGAPNAPGWALWGWFTDEQLDPATTERQLRNGLRRPTVGDVGFDLRAVITEEMIDELFDNRNLDLFAIWSLWGDANDDDRVDAADILQIQRHLHDQLMDMIGQPRIWDVTINEIASNVTMGARVDSADILRIERHLHDLLMDMIGQPRIWNIVLGTP